LRTIDSAQRRIEVTRPVSSRAGLTRVVFELQGLVASFPTGEEKYRFEDMAELGVRDMGEKPLTILQRLLRREAMVGTVASLDEHRVQVTWWTSPAIDLVFDLSRQEEANLWRECEIMALSAGFHFREI
jgi:hypothetical protein